jgi:hypothetical protein
MKKKIEARERGGRLRFNQGREKQRALEKSVEKEKEETRQNCRSTVTLIGAALGVASSRSDSNGNCPSVQADAAAVAPLPLWFATLRRGMAACRQPLHHLLRHVAPLPPPPNARAGWLSVLSKEEAKRDLGARGLSTYPVGRLLDDGNFGGKSPNRDSGILSLFVNRDDSTRDLEAEGLVPGAGRLRHDGRCTPAARPGQHRGPRANASAFLLSRQGGARVEW